MTDLVQLVWKEGDTSRMGLHCRSTVRNDKKKRLYLYIDACRFAMGPSVVSLPCTMHKSSAYSQDFGLCLNRHS